jgi:hypothetical protein
LVNIFYLSIDIVDIHHNVVGIPNLVLLSKFKRTLSI